MVTLLLALACVSSGEVRQSRAGDPGKDSAGDTDPRDSGGRDTSTDTHDTGTHDTDTGAPPPPPLRIAVISDLNGSYGSTSYGSGVSGAVAAIEADPPDLVLSTGDMVAGQRSGLDYDAMWDAFHAAVSDPLDALGVPFAITPGNHDASGYSGYEEERDTYAATWQDRRPDVEFVDDAEWPFRYSFRVRDVLFVSLDDTLVGPMSDEQREWLDQALDHPAAARIVFGHVPLYPFAEGRESEALFDEDLEDLLVARGVTAFISGHHHAYYPGRRGDLRLVGTACLGDGPRALIGTDDTSDRSLLRLVIDGGEITSLEAYGGDAFDEVIDRATLPASVGTGGDVIGRDDR